MFKVNIRYIKLHKWFPPKDSLATTVARLCILREDLFLELTATFSRSMKLLDGNTAIWRKLYFLRNTIRTVFEIRCALETLNSDASFRRMLARQSKGTREEFMALMERFRSTHPLLKGLRNAVGGHVSHEVISKALEGLSVEREGIFEAGQKLKDTHFRFAAELIVALMLADTPDSEQEEKVKEILSETFSLLPALSLIDVIFEMYIGERKLIERPRRS